LQSINSDVIKQFKTNKLGENVYKTIINLDTEDVNNFLAYERYVFSINYYLNNKLLSKSLLLNETKNVKFPFNFKHKKNTYKLFSKNGYLIYIEKGQVMNKLYGNKQNRGKIYKYLRSVFRLLSQQKKK